MNQIFGFGGGWHWLWGGPPLLAIIQWHAEEAPRVRVSPAVFMPGLGLLMQIQMVVANGLNGWLVLPSLSLIGLDPPSQLPQF